MFVPRPGQVDYTHIRYAPVLNAVVVCLGKVLLLQRSSAMRSYPNRWCGISGYLDDDRCVEDKARQEMLEEVGITSQAPSGPRTSRLRRHRAGAPAPRRPARAGPTRRPATDPAPRRASA